jgi:Mrp family chromosome partitioning ATPase
MLSPALLFGNYVIRVVELLRCPRMGPLLKHLKEIADIVLIDTPPVLTVTDGVVLAAEAEGVIVVVNEASARMKEMKEALVSLGKAGTPILGFIWNQSMAFPFAGMKAMGEGSAHHLDHPLSQAQDKFG